jgi:hypothetical protein
MINLNELYSCVENDNIFIKRCQLGNCNGLCISIKDRDFIYLNKNLNEIEEKCTLMEEFSHSKVGILPNCPFATDYHNMLIRSRNEYRATKYMINEFIPLEEFNLLKDDNEYDAIDRLEITEDLYIRIYEFMKGR